MNRCSPIEDPSEAIAVIQANGAESACSDTEYEGCSRMWGDDRVDEIRFQPGPIDRDIEQ